MIININQIDVVDIASVILMHRLEQVGADFEIVNPSKNGTMIVVGEQTNNTSSCKDVFHDCFTDANVDCNNDGIRMFTAVESINGACMDDDLVPFTPEGIDAVIVDMLRAYETGRISTEDKFVIDIYDNNTTKFLHLTTDVKFNIKTKTDEFVVTMCDLSEGNNPDKKTKFLSKYNSYFSSRAGVCWRNDNTLSFSLNYKKSK